MNVNVVVPALPSLCETSLIERVVPPDGHVVVGEELLRGAGAGGGEVGAVDVRVGAARCSSRTAAVEFVSSAVGVVSEQFVAGPYPTKSTTLAAIGQPGARERASWC